MPIPVRIAEKPPTARRLFHSETSPSRTYVPCKPDRACKGIAFGSNVLHDGSFGAIRRSYQFLRAPIVPDAWIISYATAQMGREVSGMLTLYDFGNSVCCQKVRITLVE